MLATLALALLGLLAAPAHAMTRSVTFTVAPTYAAPDGVTREILAINGQYPGPPVIVNRGDDIVMRVRNQMRVPTSMHAHGMFQYGTPYYDGVSATTQCPIAPNDEMTYHIRTADQAGTTWLHAHYKTEYGDGLVAPLIIRDPDDPHRHLYDEELIVMLNDWYHTPTEQLMSAYLAPGASANEPMPNSGLINGKGRFDCANLDTPGLQCSSNAPRESFNFQPGRRYRLRIINASIFAAFKFSIDGHKLTVIESDMVNLEPVTVDRLNINVAQRYSVIVQASARPDNYWMRAVMSTACFPADSPSLDKNVVARVHYAGTPDVDPTAPIDNGSTPNQEHDCVDLDSRMLRPLSRRDVARPTHIFQLDVTLGQDSNQVNTAYFNNITYKPDFSRSMLQDLVTGLVRTFPRDRNVYTVPLGAEVRIIVNNFDNGEHPFHLHGNEFQIVSSGIGNYNPANATFQLANPPRRDTATLPAGGYLVLQFPAVNPGLWAFHCHIEAHIMAGLVAHFQVGTARDIARMSIPSSVQRLCSGQPAKLPMYALGGNNLGGQMANQFNSQAAAMQLAGTTSWNRQMAMDPANGGHVTLRPGMSYNNNDATWNNAGDNDFD